MSSRSRHPTEQKIFEKFSKKNTFSTTRGGAPVFQSTVPPCDRAHNRWLCRVQAYDGEGAGGRRCQGERDAAVGEGRPVPQVSVTIDGSGRQKHDRGRYSVYSSSSSRPHNSALKQQKEAKTELQCTRQRGHPPRGGFGVRNENQMRAQA